MLTLTCAGALRRLSGGRRFRCAARRAAGSGPSSRAAAGRGRLGLRRVRPPAVACWWGAAAGAWRSPAAAAPPRPQRGRSRRRSRCRRSPRARPVCVVQRSFPSLSFICKNPRIQKPGRPRARVANTSSRRPSPLPKRSHARQPQFTPRAARLPNVAPSHKTGIERTCEFSNRRATPVFAHAQARPVADDGQRPPAHALMRRTGQPGRIGAHAGASGELASWQSRQPVRDGRARAAFARGRDGRIGNQRDRPFSPTPDRPCRSSVVCEWESTCLGGQAFGVLGPSGNHRGPWRCGS